LLRGEPSGGCEEFKDGLGTFEDLYMEVLTKDDV